MCVCETIAKEEQIIQVYTEQKRFGKIITVIQGIDSASIDIKKLMKRLKSKLACGGTYKEGKIELQGDHKNKIKGILQKEGFPPDIIEIR